MKKKITNGHTNTSYKEGDFFLQEKKLNKFNHKIDYEILKEFDFIPKLIYQTDKENKWEFIYGSIPEINDSTLIKIADSIKQVHNSKITFPPFNISARIKEYRKILWEKGIKIPIIHDYYKRINYILKNQDKNTPIHGDIWDQNLIEDKYGKIFIVDWEYAHMGDKNFELAYIIESLKLSDEQETIFLEQYDDYNYQFLKNHKELVNYLIILWNNSQTIKYFEDDEFIKKLEKFKFERENKNV
ncbi:MAG: phosphotransferase [Mycoplasmataceae bacterium]|nr:phosphotransferase [Mycoplasmataceae bacterium]